MGIIAVGMNDSSILALSMAFESYKRDEEKFQNCLIYVCFLSIAEYTILQERIAIHPYANEQYVLVLRYLLLITDDGHVMLSDASPCAGVAPLTD